MADSNAPVHHHLNLTDALPLPLQQQQPQLNKDIQEPDNPFPLSPQWLLAKSGENKHGMESHVSSNPGHSTRLINGDGIQDSEKKRDVFRPSIRDADGRRDLWRDEERDNSSSIRRDRWRESEKEFGDTRKPDRWTENSLKNTGEVRRAPMERWTNFSDRDGNHDQRRDDKWGTRWGSNEKGLDSGREGEVPRDKILPPLTNPSKDDREGEHYRPWRSSAAQSRGRGDPTQNQIQTPSKQTPPFGYGRGRGENTPPSFGRGRSGSGGSNFPPYSHPVGFVLDKDEHRSAHGKDSSLRYSRTELVDLFKKVDMKSSRKPLDSFLEVPTSLMQAEPLHPLALSVPTPEEAVIMKGIEKGDIVGSGLPQTQPGRNKLGSREDLLSPFEDGVNESADNFKGGHLNASGNPPEKYVHPYRSDTKLEATQNFQMHHDNKLNTEASRSEGTPHNRTDEVAAGRDAGFSRNVTQSGTPWRSQTLEQRLHDRRDHPSDDRPRFTGMSNLPNYHKDEPKWQAGEGVQSSVTQDSVLRRQLSYVFDKERESRHFMPPQVSPEELSLCYIDPKGDIQGPFAGIDLIGWFESGYFGIDLKVRLSNASPDTPFSFLGDVMPHLRAKARPPPGFGGSKPSELAETVSRPNFGSLGMTNLASSEIDVMKEDPRNRQESGTEVENRFLESLMSGNTSRSPLEGLQGFMGSNLGNNTVGMPSMGGQSGNDLNYLLAQRMSIERQRSLPNHSLPSVVENPLQSSHHQNFPQQAAYGVQQRLQHQNLPSLQHLLPQTLDHNSSGMSTQEKLLTSALPQDPQLLNLLQQQYLLSQLQLQSPAPVPIAPTQLTLADKYLLFKQQEEQREQQQLLHQQQQHLISKLYSERQSRQNITEPFGNSGLVDPFGLRQPHEIFQNKSQMPVSNLQDGPVASKVPQEFGYPVSSGAASLHMPHQMFGNINNLIGQQSLPLEQAEEIRQGEVPVEVVFQDRIARKGAIIDGVSLSASELVSSSMSSERDRVPDSVPSSRTDNEELLATNQVSGMIAVSSVGPEELMVQKYQSEAVVDVKEEINVEGHDVKKASEKKSKKQKNSKAQLSSDVVKGASTVPPPQQSKQSVIKETNGADIDAGGKTKFVSRAESVESRHVQSSLSGDLDFGSTQSGHRGWKPAPGLKAKSFLEIQQEEQQTAQMEMAVSDTVPPTTTVGSSMPWSGIRSNSEFKASDRYHDSSVSQQIAEKYDKSKKSHLHDLLAEEVLAKSSDRTFEVPENFPYMSSISDLNSQKDLSDDDFILAKDSKKSRKKSAKGKSAAVKATAVAPSEATVALSPIEKSKASRQVQQEKAAPLSGPSLGDFVLWKGESANSAPAPAPAWSSDSGKFSKPTSLRDIQKEQEKKTSSVQHQHPPVPIPTKAQSTRGTRGSGNSFTAAGSSPAKAASPVQVNSAYSAQMKSKEDDDLFWGPIDHSKQESKQSFFPSVVNPSAQVIKKNPVKGMKGAVTGGSAGRSKAGALSSSPSAQSSQKGKRDARTEQSEATGFREWCEKETIRLTGSKDTSFLEYCLKQSNSEAETLLKQNLGSFDPDHTFIAEFLNYKNILSADVLDIAFQARDHRSAEYGVADAGIANHDPDNGMGANAAGKKKGKKGKKVSPLVLGFNVVSNRIMMGEIQTIED